MTLFMMSLTVILTVMTFLSCSLSWGQCPLGTFQLHPHGRLLLLDLLMPLQQQVPWETHHLLLLLLLLLVLLLLVATVILLVLLPGG